MKAAYRRAFGLAIVQLKYGEMEFNLQEKVDEFDGVIRPFDVRTEEEVE